MTRLTKEQRELCYVKAMSSLRVAYLHYQQWQEYDGDGETFLDWIQDHVTELERESFRA